MTSKFAFGATVAAIILCIRVGASAQTYEVTKIVPGSAFHGVQQVAAANATLPAPT